MCLNVPTLSVVQPEPRTDMWERSERRARGRTETPDHVELERHGWGSSGTRLANDLAPYQDRACAMFNCAAWHELNLKCKLLGKKLSEHHSWDFSHPPPARLAGTAGPHQLVLPVWFHHREVSVSTPVSLSSHTFVYYKERCNAPDKDLGPCACFFFLFFFHDLNPGVDCSCVTQLQCRFHYAHICFCFEIWAQTSWQHKAVSYEYNNLLSTKIRP